MNKINWTMAVSSAVGMALFGTAVYLAGRSGVSSLRKVKNIVKGN